MKRCIAILLTLTLLLLSACGAGQAPASEPESSPSSISESAPETSSSGPSPVGSVPDQLPQEELNPDFGWGPEDERINQITRAVQDDLLPQLPETAYSYLSVYEDASEVVLRIGVVDEAAIDSCLAAWTGDQWDRLIKEPALYSRAMRDEFVEKAQRLDFGPEIKATIGTFPPIWSDEAVVFGVMLTAPEAAASQEEVQRLETMPQQIKDLAQEMGIPEDVIDYGFGYVTTPEPSPGSEPPVG